MELSDPRPPLSESRNSNRFKIITVVLGVLLLASMITIAILAFSRTPAKENHPTAQTDSITPKSDGATSKSYRVAIDDSFGYSLEFTYPSKWKLSQSVTGPMPINTNTGPTTQKFTLISPSGNLAVTYKIEAGGKIDGQCNQNTAGQFVSTSSRLVSGLPIASFTEYTMKNYTDTYANGPYYAGLMNTNTTRVFAPEGSLCRAYQANIISLSKENMVNLIDASIYIKDIHSIDDYSAAKSTEEYKQATAILMSTVHE